MFAWMFIAPAAREVNTLQVAFQHAVTPLIDKGLIAGLAKLEELRPRLVRDHAITIPGLPQGPRPPELVWHLEQIRETLSLNSTEQPPQAPVTPIPLSDRAAITPATAVP